MVGTCVVMGWGDMEWWKWVMAWWWWRCGDMMSETGRDGRQDGVGGCRESDGVHGLGMGGGNDVAGGGE